MNIEGAVKLGYRKELMAIEDPEARLAEFQRRTASGLRQRQGGQRRGRRRDRRRDRSGGHARLDRQRPETPAAGAGADRRRSTRTSIRGERCLTRPATGAKVSHMFPRCAPGDLSPSGGPGHGFLSITSRWGSRRASISGSDVALIDHHRSPRRARETDHVPGPHRAIDDGNRTRFEEELSRAAHSCRVNVLRLRQFCPELVGYLLLKCRHAP